MIQTKTFLVSGRVQGVWFRKFTCDKATELLIRGTVQNRDDGSVLIHAQGTAAQLQELEEWCWQGSPLSEVEHVESSELNSAESYSQFSIIE